MSLPSPRKVQITFDPRGVIAPALLAIKHATEIVTVCEEAIERTRTQSFSRCTDQRIQRCRYVRGTQEPLSVWLLAKAFQDLMRGLRASLEEAHFYVTMAKELTRAE